MKEGNDMAVSFQIDTSIARSARDVLGEYLPVLGKADPALVLVNADLAGSCRVRACQAAFPNRYYNVGIAEQSMVSFAAGMAHEGFQPIVYTMAPFLSMRACEQVRSDICYGELPVILIGTGAGYSASVQGATHCALEDCAIFGAMGGMAILEPGDPYIAIKMLDAAVARKKPVYIRIGRDASRAIYPDDTAYEIGRALTPREGNDGAFLVSGLCVTMALQAAERLHQELAVKIRVVDMHTIKPIDKDAVLSAAKTGRIVCAQDHAIIGGLGYAAAAVLAEAGVSCRFKMLGCPDQYVPLAKPEFLYHRNGYDAEGLYQAMKNML